jgi:hypothetical protein
MLLDLTFPRYLTTFSGKKGLSGKVICAFLSRLSKFSCIYEGLVELPVVWESAKPIPVSDDLLKSIKDYRQSPTSPKTIISGVLSQTPYTLFTNLLWRS